MPSISPRDASRSTWLISSALVALSVWKVRSTTETFGVGTRMEMPSNLPFSSGSTRPTAFAAPVVVGIIDSAAARPRLQSLCGKSRIS